MNEPGFDDTSFEIGYGTKHNGARWAARYSSKSALHSCARLGDFWIVFGQGERVAESILKICIEVVYFRPLYFGIAQSIMSNSIGGGSFLPKIRAQLVHLLIRWSSGASSFQGVYWDFAFALHHFRVSKSLWCIYFRGRSLIRIASQRVRLRLRRYQTYHQWSFSHVGNPVFFTLLLRGCNSDWLASWPRISNVLVDDAISLLADFGLSRFRELTEESATSYKSVDNC